MPGETIDLSEPWARRRYAQALKCTFTVCRLSWTCPQCGARNHSDFDGARLRRPISYSVEARCGKCHSPKVHLLNAKNQKILTSELLPRPH